MKFVILFLFIIVLFAAAITLGANNDQTVTFNYLIAQSEFRLSTLLAIVLGTGFVLGWLITAVFYLRVRIKLTAVQRRLKKIQKQYDDEVASHRKTQLTSSVPTLPQQ
ncbi:LapA family protein [Zophobihabitans entericus]|uniref:Probable lipopolysaccharide assembly protein A n=1 Tax=Zophobihabitans entericus TaxID=1635327 RepID=A0A6G9IAF1_9GAMM|nr:lipopolysaccharide assembly protein LapA domain-containing protein [Zophobihabitans entericus]QIQ21201.1 DUF1049 domain-containing protein [Zophobihabitans entericus]